MFVGFFWRRIDEISWSNNEIDIVLLDFFPVYDATNCGTTSPNACCVLIVLQFNSILHEMHNANQKLFSPFVCHAKLWFPIFGNCFSVKSTNFCGTDNLKKISCWINMSECKKIYEIDWDLKTFDIYIRWFFPAFSQIVPLTFKYASYQFRDIDWQIEEAVNVCCYVCIIEMQTFVMFYFNTRWIFSSFADVSIEFNTHFVR